MMASYGNAGHFSPYAVLQLNRPDILYDIPKMILSSYGSIGSKMELYSQNVTMDISLS